ncbi:MAG TPA: YncE family protein [Nitrosopumilaceae archaeon]|nr:YncE family protein [Nitrosopumilaceae archaeon]
MVILNLILVSLFADNVFAYTLDTMGHTDEQASGIAVNSKTHLIYMSTHSGQVYVINGSTTNIISKIDVGYDANRIAINEKTNTIYVDDLTNKVSVIDGNKNAVTGQFETGLCSCDVAVNPITNTVYVVNPVSDVSIYIIKGTTNQIVDKIKAINPVFVTVNPNTNMIYVTNSRTGALQGKTDSVYVINGTTNKIVDEVFVGKGAYGISVNPTTDKIYVANQNDNSVSVIDGNTNKVVGNIQVTGYPHEITVNPITNTIYVSSSYDGVSVIDGFKNTVVATIKMDMAPSKVAVDTERNLEYVVNNYNDSISIIKNTVDENYTISTIEPVAKEIQANNTTIASTAIIWNPPSFSVGAFPGASLPLNFSSNQNLNGVLVNISNQLDWLVLQSGSAINIQQGDQTLPISLVILPNASSGWHNGTITFSVNGVQLHKQFYLNMLVPPTVSNIMQQNPYGEMVTVMSPSYSPYFNNTYDAAQYLIFKNGKVLPIRVFYDIFSNMTVAQFTKLANNTAHTNNEPSIPVFPSKTSQESKTISIPAWVKLTAGWWAYGHVGNSDFMKGIQYLIQQKIIKIPQTVQYTSLQPGQIPQWIKNDAGWWANDQISDDEFVKGIQYLIDNGIIIV